MIYKSFTVPVNSNKSDYNYLMKCNGYSAIIWNACVKADQENRKINGKSLTQSELQFMMKKSVPILLANSINLVIIKYLTARNAMWESRKAKHTDTNKIKLPHKEKKFFNTLWNYQNIKVYKEKGYITLGKPNVIDQEGNIRRQKPIKCHMKSIPNNIVEIELIYRNKLYLVIKTKQENDNVLIQSDNIASIDLGEIHSITSIDNNGNAIIITGRKLREIKQLRNKEMAKIKSRMSKCKKGSRQYKKYNKALWNLKYKTDNKIKDAVHKITKLYLEYCLENNIGKVYYGNLDNCTRNTKKERKTSRFMRQKLTQWCFGLIILQLENKLSRYGIEMVKVKEYYSSTKCPNCSEINKPKRRNYKCKCGYNRHRDIVGAINILNDNSNYKIQRYNNLKYLRIA